MRLLKWLMKLTGGLAAKEVSVVNVEKMENWLMSLAEEDNGYKHYYTMRKRHIQEGLTSGITQEQYWFNCGRLEELKFINASAMRLIKAKKHLENYESVQKQKTSRLDVRKQTRDG